MFQKLRVEFWSRLKHLSNEAYQNGYVMFEWICHVLVIELELGFNSLFWRTCNLIWTFFCIHIMGMLFGLDWSGFYWYLFMWLKSNTNQTLSLTEKIQRICILMLIFKTLKVKTCLEVGTLFQFVTFCGNFDWICNLLIQKFVLKNLQFDLEVKLYHWQWKFKILIF
jgi:hypothetical protein